MKVDIYGAGLSGLTLARLLTDKGHEVTVFEKSDHIGGMMETERKYGIEIHKHGAHLFHTDHDEVIEFIKRFSDWTPYVHKVAAEVTKLGKTILVSLPLSYQSFADFSGVKDPETIKYLLSATSRMRHPNKNVDDLISRIGWDLYDYVIKPYSEKQWGCKFEDIPSGVIDRIGMTEDFNTNYFKDKFQALPSDGYDAFLRNLAEGLDIRFNVTKFNYRDVCTIFTGPIDDLVGNEVLPYRSLTWLHQVTEDAGTLPVINTPQHQASTRYIIHNNFINNPESGIIYKSVEYPMDYKLGSYRYYPVNNERTAAIYSDYVGKLKTKYPKLHFNGRLGLYRYLDMDDVIYEAIKLVNEL